MKFWKDEISEALAALGGEADLAEIYARVAHSRSHLTRSWQATIRGTIERHSSDSNNFESEDLFYSVGGLGSGRWGLRSRH